MPLVQSHSHVWTRSTGADEPASLGEALSDAAPGDGEVGPVGALLHVRERQRAELDRVVNARRPVAVVGPVAPRSLHVGPGVADLLEDEVIRLGDVRLDAEAREVVGLQPRGCDGRDWVSARIGAQQPRQSSRRAQGPDPVRSPHACRVQAWARPLTCASS